MWHRSTGLLPAPWPRRRPSQAGDGRRVTPQAVVRATRTHAGRDGQASRNEGRRPDGPPTRRPRVRSPAGHRCHNVAASGRSGESVVPGSHRTAASHAPACAPLWDRRSAREAGPRAGSSSCSLQNRFSAEAACLCQACGRSLGSVILKSRGSQARSKRRAKQAGPPSRQPLNCAPQLQPRRATRGPQLPLRTAVHVRTAQQHPAGADAGQARHQPRPPNTPPVANGGQAKAAEPCGEEGQLACPAPLAREALGPEARLVPQRRWWGLANPLPNASAQRAQLPRLGPARRRLASPSSDRTCDAATSRRPSAASWH